MPQEPRPLGDLRDIAISIQSSAKTALRFTRSADPSSRDVLMLRNIERAADELVARIEAFQFSQKTAPRVPDLPDPEIVAAREWHCLPAPGACF